MPKFIHRKKLAEVTVKSHWPVWMRRVFDSLREIPWLPLTAIGTLFGVLVLSLYFQSINYFPMDRSALFGLGIATAVCAFGLYGLLSIVVFAPAALYRQYRADDKVASSKSVRAFSTLELIGLQLGSVAMLFLLMAYPKYRDCDVLFSSYGVIAMALLLPFLGALTRIVLSKGTIWQRLERVNVGIGVAVFGALFTPILSPLLSALKAESYYFLILFFSLWGLAILANAFLAERFPVIALVLVGALVIWILFIAAPALVGKAGMFPQMVATAMGIRQEKSQEFRVPSKTCLLIQSGLGATSNPNVNCDSGDWSVIKVQVLSNVGDQWFVEIPMEATQRGPTPSLRMTIPKADVYLIQSQSSGNAEKVKTTCDK
ncbi:MAG: hypothetical protein V4713_12580 [Pseudomonadota bacterium]